MLGNCQTKLILREEKIIDKGNYRIGKTLELWHTAVTDNILFF